MATGDSRSRDAHHFTRKCFDDKTRNGSSSRRCHGRGTWVNPPDSADYEGIPSAEVFNADGTYSYIEYEDKECQRVSGAVHSKWYVWDGTIVNEVGEGKTLKDEIVNMAPKKMVLRSLEDSLTYHRVRSTAKTRACAGTPPQPK